MTADTLGRTQVTPPAEPATNQLSLDQVYQELSTGNAEDFYRHAVIVDAVAGGFQDHLDRIENHVREIGESWLGAGSDKYTDVLAQASGNLTGLLAALREPDYGGLLRQVGDILSFAQQRITALKTERDQAVAANPAADQSTYDYQAQQLMRSVYDQYVTLGEQFAELPEFTVLGNPVPVLTRPLPVGPDEIVQTVDTGFGDPGPVVASDASVGLGSIFGLGATDPNAAVFVGVRLSGAGAGVLGRPLSPIVLTSAVSPAGTDDLTAGGFPVLGISTAGDSADSAADPVTENAAADAEAVEPLRPMVELEPVVDRGVLRPRRRHGSRRHGVSHGSGSGSQAGSSAGNSDATADTCSHITSASTATTAPAKHAPVSTTSTASSTAAHRTAAHATTAKNSATSTTSATSATAEAVPATKTEVAGATRTAQPRAIPATATASPVSSATGQPINQPPASEVSVNRSSVDPAAANPVSRLTETIAAAPGTPAGLPAGVNGLPQLGAAPMSTPNPSAATELSSVDGSAGMPVNGNVPAQQGVPAIGAGGRALPHSGGAGQLVFGPGRGRIPVVRADPGTWDQLDNAVAGALGRPLSEPEPPAQPEREPKENPRNV